MEKFSKKLFFITFVFFIVISFVSLGILLQEDKKFTATDNMATPLEFSGIYSIDDGQSWATIEKDGISGLTGKNTLILKGHFNRDIPEGHMMVLRIDNLKISMFLEDEKIYSFGENGTFSKYADSPGNLWDQFVCPEILASSNITFFLSNTYTNHVSTSFNIFINNIHSGIYNNLILENIQDNLLNTFISIFIISLGIIVLFFSIFLRSMKVRSSTYAIFSLLCITTGLWFFLDFDVASLYLPYPTFNNVLDFLSMTMILAFFLLYTLTLLKGKGKLYVRLLCIATFILVCVSILCQLFRVCDVYNLMILLGSFASPAILFSAIIVMHEGYKHNNSDAKEFAASIFVVAAGVVLDLFLYSIFQVIEKTICFKISFLVFILIQFFYLSRYMRTIIIDEERKKTLETMAYRDALTGVKNRTSYVEFTEKMNADLNNSTDFAITICDVNNLKITNDTKGHNVGDTIITESCAIICNTFKHSPVFRIGGDEFAVISKDEDFKNIETLLANLAKHTTERNRKRGAGETPVSFSFGMSTFNHQEDKCVEDVFHRADKEMYKNKLEFKKTLNNIN